ncbi:MAG: hypothetical protein HYR68_13185 [Burkholderiales bacterium]|nr:hypothetical protein [Burkholderiales bacterium]MBI3729191.1 hypothetical protein [Burkholderiales bacterium]
MTFPLRLTPLTLASICLVTTCVLPAGTVHAQNTAVSLSISLTGTGRISSEPAGIRCDNTCVGNFNAGTNVTLTATPANKYMTLGSWGGACSGSGPTCVVTMNAAKSVTASFKYLNVQPIGQIGAPVTVKWKAPSTRADGSLLGGLAGLTGYKVYGSKTQYDLTPALLATVQNPLALSASINGLATGTWYFWASATTTDAESELQYLNQAVVRAATP